MFGEAQFTEGDIIPINEDVRVDDDDVDVDIEGDEGVQHEQLRLRELVAAGKLAQIRPPGQATEIQQANISTCRCGDNILALEVKVTDTVSRISC